MRLTRRGKRRLVVLVVVTAFVCIGGATTFTLRLWYRTHLAARARENGLLAHSQGQYERALGELSYALSRSKADLEALLAFADSRSKVFEVNNRHLVSAVKYYNTILRLDPINFEALVRLLDLYQRLNYQVELMDVADRILALDADHIEALSAKAYAHYREGRFDAAISMARQLGLLQPQELSWRALQLKAVQAQGADDEAILDLCDRWIAAFEKDGRFRLLKAQILGGLGEAKGARLELIAGAKLGADSTDVLQAMLGMCDFFNLREQSDELLASAKVRLPGEPWVYEAGVGRYWRTLRFAEALSEVAQAEEAIGSLSMRLLRFKVLLHAFQRQTDQTSEALASLLDRIDHQPPEDRNAQRAWAQAIRARMQMSGSNLLDCVRTYQGAIALAPRDPILHYLLAEVYQRLGEHELAASLFERTGRLDPYWIGIQIARAPSLLALGRAEEAFRIMSGVIARTPEAGLAAYLLLGRAWLNLGQSGERIRLTNTRTGESFGLVGLLEFVQKMAPRSAQATVLLGEAYLRQENFAETVELIQEALRDERADPRTLLLLSTVSERGDLGLERQLVERAQELAGLTLEVAGARASILQGEGRIDEGLALIDEALASAPNSEQSARKARRLRLGLLLEAGSPDALPAMTDLLSEEPDSPSAAIFALAQNKAWEHPELIQDAIDHLRRNVGQGSLAVRLAEATYLYRSQPDDSAALARATMLTDEALTLAPDSKRALTLMALLQLRGEDPRPDEAIRYLRRAVDRYPSEVDLYPRLISLLQQQGDFDAAERYLSGLGAHRKLTPALRRAELQLLQAQGDFEAAIIRLTDVLDDYSTESDQLVLASLYQRLGDYEEAERVYELVLASPECSATAVRAAADFYADIGRLNEALALLESLDTSPVAHALTIGAFYHKQGYLEEAGRWLREAVKMAPDNAEAWLQLAKYCLAIGDYEEAREAALSGRNVDRTNAKLRALLAVASLNLTGQARHEALDVFRELEGEGEPWLATVNFYDRVVDDEGRFAPTARDVADVRELVHEHPQFLPAWRLAVTMHAEAGRIDEAVQLAKQAMTRLPTQAEPAEWATRLLIQAGQLAEALEIAQTWRRRSLEKPIVVDTVIASLQLDLGRPRSAVEQLAPHVKRIWYERDRFPGRMTVWLRALLFDRQFDRAASLIQLLAAEAERWRDVWLALARASSPDIAYEAILILEPALLQRPEDMLVLATEWAALAQWAGEPSHYDRAEELVREVERDNTFGVRALLLRGSIAVSRGEFDVAEQHYRRVLEGDPDNLVALNNLAYVLLELRQGYDEAHALSARAINLAPNNPDLLDTHAQALAGLDRLDEAERTVRLALAQRSDDPALLLTLTRILMAQSRLDEAEAELAEVQRILTTLSRADNRVMAEADALRQRIDDLSAQAAP